MCHQIEVSEMENVEKIPVVIILHAYQPITQDKEILERIINNCYTPFLSKLIENSDIKITLNISGCLLEKLSIEYPEIIRLVEKGILNNQIELMGSAFYHPILPLISDEEENELFLSFSVQILLKMYNSVKLYFIVLY